MIFVNYDDILVATRVVKKKSTECVTGVWLWNCAIEVNKHGTTNDWGKDSRNVNVGLNADAIYKQEILHIQCMRGG